MFAIWRRVITSRAVFVVNLVDWFVGASGLDGEVLGLIVHPAIAITLLTISTMLIAEHVRDKWRTRDLFGDPESALCGLGLNSHTRIRPLRAAHEILGATTRHFQLYEAACLLVGDVPVWPLPSARTRNEYADLYKAIREGRLDDPTDFRDDTLSIHLSLLEFEDEEREKMRPDLVKNIRHELEIDRWTLRRYLSVVNRSIPEFLEERFDS